MKAAVLTGVRKMEVREVPDPKIEKGTDVLLKIETVGVCGSDVHYFETGRIGSQVVQFPYIVGHECAATVAQIGPDVKNLKVGQEVVVEPAVSCHACEQCNVGRENTCFNLRFLGTPGQGNGCLSEYIVMPEECCLPTDGKISLEQGASASLWLSRSTPSSGRLRPKGPMSRCSVPDRSGSAAWSAPRPTALARAI